MRGAEIQQLCTCPDVDLSCIKAASSAWLGSGRVSGESQAQPYLGLPWHTWQVRCSRAGKQNKLWSIGGLNIFRQLMWLVLVGYKAQSLSLCKAYPTRGANCLRPGSKQTRFSYFSSVREYEGANKANKTMIDLVCLVAVASDCITSSSQNSYHSNEKYLQGFRDF